MGFEAPLVLCDATTAEPDFYLLFLDHDLDGFADMPMRGTISNCVDINKAVGTDTTRQAASAYGQRACLQGAQGLALVTLEADARLFLGCAMDPLVGDLDHPPSQVTLQNLEGSEQATGQCVVLDVANSPFDLPLGPSATGTTGFGCQPTVTAKGLESWIPDHLAGLAIVGGHQWRGVVTEDLLGEAPKMLEGSFQPLEPVVLSLREEGPAIKPARVSQHGGHQINLDGLTGDRDDLFTEVDLDLLARRGLKPDSGQRPGPFLLTQGRHGPLQGPQVDLDPSGGQFLLNDDGVSLGNGTEELVDFTERGAVEAPRRKTFLKADRGSSEITADGVAGDPQLSSNPFAPETLAGKLADPIHDIRFQHPGVLLRRSQVDIC